MKLSDLLTSVRGQLHSKKQYGLSLLTLFQSQIHADPSHVIMLNDIDGRQTDLRLLALGKQVDLDAALQSAIKTYHAVELDDDQASGFRFTEKGLTVTVTWRKRTSDERIQDVAQRHIAKKYAHGTVTGRLSWPLHDKNPCKEVLSKGDFISVPLTFFADDQSKRIQVAIDTAASWAGKNPYGEIDTGMGDGSVWREADFSGLEERVVSWMYGFPQELVNCRCVPLTEKPKKRTKVPVIEQLPQSLRQLRRENTLPRDMVAGGGIVLPIVGSSYRTPKQQAVLKSKSPGNMVLIAHEPDNAVDRNALAVFTWEVGGSSWHHVGYLQKALNKGLLDRMVQMGGGSTERIALRGVLVDDPGFGGNPRLRLTEVWSFGNSLRA